MRCFARYIFHRPLGRRCVCASLLLAYVVTAAGVPISIGSLAQKSGEVFPCMASSCGCRTADQCWRSCCCHSLVKRLAWARQRGVQPPAFAIAQARAVGKDLSSIATVGRSCDEASECCRSDSGTTPIRKLGSCCSDQRVDSSSDDSKQDTIVAWRALACRGISTDWLAAVPSLIIDRPERSHKTLLVRWLGPTTSEAVCSESGDPAVPPPECV